VRALERAAEAVEAFRIGELFTGVQDAIWSETKAAEAIGINSFRRSLQRAHLGKMLGLLLRDGGAPEDGRTMARHGLLALRGQLNTALTGQAKMPLETRAHLGESLARIDEALKANMQRTAF